MARLRKLYMQDKEARAFLAEHPEFAGFDLESTHDRPSHDAEHTKERERSTRTERNAFIAEALAHFDEDADVKALLELYFSGATGEALCAHTGRPREATKQLLYRAKSRVYMWALEERSAPLSPRDVCREFKTLIYHGVTKAVYKVPTKAGRDVWVSESWKLLPQEVQDVLDEIEWDILDLSVSETGEAL